METVTFDFDGCLHLDVTSDGAPLDPFAGEDLTPNKPLIRRLRQEAGYRDVYIVTAREDNTRNRRSVQEFIDKHDLPVADFLCTSNRDKGPFLSYLGSIRHYDDKRYHLLNVDEDQTEIIIVGEDIPLPKFRRGDIEKTQRSPISEAAKRTVGSS